MKLPVSCDTRRNAGQGPFIKGYTLLLLRVDSTEPGYFQNGRSVQKTAQPHRFFGEVPRIKHQVMDVFQVLDVFIACISSWRPPYDF